VPLNKHEPSPPTDVWGRATKDLVGCDGGGEVAPEQTLDGAQHAERGTVRCAAPPLNRSVGRTCPDTVAGETFVVILMV